MPDNTHADEPVTRGELVSILREFRAEDEQEARELAKREQTRERMRQTVASDSADNRSAEPDPETQLSRLAREVGLTPDQLAKAIEAGKRAEMKECVRECLDELVDEYDEYDEDEEDDEDELRGREAGNKKAGNGSKRRPAPDSAPEVVHWSEKRLWG